MAGAEIPDFIWQHQYNKKWFTYTADEMKIINKACKRNQKTVSLPSATEKKKLTVNLPKMYQINSETGFEQRVRCVICNGDFYVWQWQGEHAWNSYTPRVAFNLEIAHKCKEPKVKFYINGDYEVDLHNFKQINVETDFSRNISREKVDIPTNNPDTAMYNLKTSKNFEDYLTSICAQRDSSSMQVIFEISTDAPTMDSTVPDNTNESGSTSVPKSPLPSSNPSPFDITCNIDSKNISLLTSISKATKLKDKLIPIDSVCEEKSNYHIYCEGSVIYTAMLNLTNLQNNNNKFYILQLIEHNKKKIYCVWYRWGRVGNKGACNLLKFGSNVNDAKAEFEKKFYSKTHNEWIDRSNFEKVSGKYDLLQMDLTPEVKKRSENVPVINLDPKVQSLFELICDKKVMEEIMSDMFYDSNKTPLGKLTAKQIIEGYSALDKISKIIIQQGKGSALINACNEFYTKIPHNFGRKVPPLIQTLDDVREKLNMMETLSNINEAMTVMNEGSGDENADPLYKYYKSLDCTLQPLESTSEEYIALEKCLLETHGPTHLAYTMEIVDVFKCSKQRENSKFVTSGNNMLLWHGSRITNWLGILKQGLRIAPPEAPQTGYMFGKGIYFADSSSKSANYCYATKKKNEGLLLLSEVSLGNTLQLRKSEDMPRALPLGYNSVKGVGRIVPQSFLLTALSDKATVPRGPFIEKEESEDLDLIYNEYIVYNPCQVRMQYLVRMKFNFP